MITNRCTGLMSVTTMLVLTMSAVAFAQPGPGGGGGGGGGPGGPGGGPPPGGMFRMMGPRDALNSTIQVLGDLNLSPDFTLSTEQKQKIQAIRDAFKQQQEKWRTEHAAELQKIDEQMQELRDAGGPPDPDQMQDIEEARRAVNSSAPDGEDESAQVKALLTPEQAKQFESREAEMQRNRQRMRDGGPGGPGRR